MLLSVMISEIYVMYQVLLLESCYFSDFSKNKNFALNMNVHKTQADSAYMTTFALKILKHVNTMDECDIYIFLCVPV